MYGIELELEAVTRGRKMAEKSVISFPHSLSEVLHEILLIGQGGENKA